MTFAQISIQEIQQLHHKKASGLQIVIYQIIASHIHSKTRNNAFPSLKRIQMMLGGEITIQSITRAITALETKGLILKGKIRSKTRFQLIHRPIVKIAKQKIRKTIEHAKHFISRWSPKNLTKPFHSDTKPIGLQKISIQEKKSKSIFEERGEEVWEKLCPNALNDNFKSISAEEKELFLTWLHKNGNEHKDWIKDYFKEQIQALKGEMV